MAHIEIKKKKKISCSFEMSVKQYYTKIGENNKKRK